MAQQSNQARGRAAGGPHTKHSDGFDAAINDALQDADRKWGAGTWPTVTVQLQASVETHSPGVIHEYVVLLDKP